MGQRFVIVRHSAPSSLDEAKYGSICMTKDSSSLNYHIYLQVHKQSDTPQWESLGVFTSSTSQEYIESIINNRLQE